VHCAEYPFLKRGGHILHSRKERKKGRAKVRMKRKGQGDDQGFGKEGGGGNIKMRVCGNGLWREGPRERKRKEILRK
jgi:hypothetical protein